MAGRRGPARRTVVTIQEKEKDSHRAWRRYQDCETSRNACKIGIRHGQVDLARCVLIPLSSGGDQGMIHWWTTNLRRARQHSLTSVIRAVLFAIWPLSILARCYYRIKFSA